MGLIHPSGGSLIIRFGICFINSIYHCHLSFTIMFGFQTFSFLLTFRYRRDFKLLLYRILFIWELNIIVIDHIIAYNNNFAWTVSILYLMQRQWILEWTVSFNCLHLFVNVIYKLQHINNKKHGCLFLKDSAKDLNLWVTLWDVWWHFPCDCVWHGWCRSVTARHNNAVTSVHHCHSVSTPSRQHNSQSLETLRLRSICHLLSSAQVVSRMWRGGCKVEGNVRSMTRHDLMTFMSCHHCSLCDSPLFSSVRLHSLQSS